RYGRDVGGEFAHQATDDLSPHAILGPERIASADGKPPAPDRGLPIAGRGRVLHVSRGQAADRRHSETDENGRRVRRIALKVAVKLAGAESDREPIIRPGEMIQAHRRVSRGREGISDAINLRKPLPRARK